jgi:hypothetical protein
MNADSGCITIEKYWPASNPDFKNNVLINWAPPLSREAIGEVMCASIAYSENERTHDFEQRIQYVLRLNRYFAPLDSQVDFGFLLWSLVCSSYALRNPDRETTSGSFTEFMESIAAGAVAPTEHAEFLDSPWACLLIGTPGTGKSSTPNAVFLRLFPGVFRHKLKGDLYQLGYVRVQAPKSGSALAIASDIYHELYEAAQQTGLPMPYAGRTRPRTIPEFIRAISVLAIKLNVGLIVVDEIQHMCSARGQLDEEAMKFLTGLLSKVKVPMLLIGTWEAFPLLTSEARISRRGTSPGCTFFRRMAFGDDFKAFVRLLWTYQWTASPVALTDKMLAVFYEHTQGIPDLIVKLYAICQIEAIFEDDRFDHDFVEKVATEHMPLMAPAIRLLRDGVREDDERLWDLEPQDIEKYLVDYAASVLLAGAKRRGRRLKSAPGKAQAQARAAVAAALTATGAVTPATAEVLAQKAVEANPSKTPVEQVRSVLNASVPKGPRPTRSVKERAKQEMHAKFEALDDDDLRKIAYQAHAESKSIADAFFASGDLCTLLEDVPL